MRFLLEYNTMHCKTGTNVSKEHATSASRVRLKGHYLFIYLFTIDLMILPVVQTLHNKGQFAHAHKSPQCYFLLPEC